MRLLLCFLAAASALINGSAQSLDNWQVPETLPQSGGLNAVAFGNGLFVAAGEGAAFLVSSNGTAWTQQSFPAGATAINSLEFANDIFMAVGDAGVVHTSADGASWNSRSAGTSMKLVAVAYGNGRWVAVGRANASGQSTVLSSSDNGQNWAAHPTAPFEITGLTFGNGYFVASGIGGLTTDIRRTPDLTNWTSGLSFDFGNTLRNVACPPGGNRFVAIGDQGRLLHSLNGITWVEGNSAVTRSLSGIAVANGIFVAVGEQECITSSTDGISWVARREPSSSSVHLTDAAYGNGIWVAAGYQQVDFWSPRKAAMLVSDSATGCRFSFASSAVLANRGTSAVEIVVKRLGSAIGQVSVDFSTSDFTATAGQDYVATNATLSWSDGDSTARTIAIPLLNNNSLRATESFKVNLLNPSAGAALGTPSSVTVTIPAIVPEGEWATRYPLLAGERPRAFTTNKSTAVAVGEFGSIATSGDGLTWVNEKSGTREHLNGVAFGNGSFVSVGDAGVILSSTNGTNWVVRSWAGNADLNSVHFAGGRFVVAGSDGKIISSTNGENWSLASTGTEMALNTVTYGSNLWLAAGDDGALLTSSTGETWILQTPPTVPGINLIKAAFGNGTFVILTTHGFHLTSSNGTEWKPRLADVRLNVITTPVLNDISYVRNTFIALSSQGFVYSSVDGVYWEKTDSPLENPLVIGEVFHLPVILGEEGSLAYATYPNRWNLFAERKGYAFLGAAYGLGRYVAVGEQGEVHVSNDATFWTRQTKLGATLRTIIFAGGQFVAGGEEGVIYTSSDGLNWFAQTSGSLNRIHQIIHNGSHYYASTETTGQASSALLKSADGVNWESVYTPGSLTSLKSVAYGNGIYVVVGDGNFSERSTDGSNFTSLSAPNSSRAFVGVTFGNGLFVRVRHQIGLTTVTNAAFEVSADGRSWEQAWSSAQAEFSSIAFIDGQFVALGKGGLILTSADGRTWANEAETLHRDLYGITSNPTGDWIVVGNRGSVHYRFHELAPVLTVGFEITPSGSSYANWEVTWHATAAALGAEIERIDHFINGIKTIEIFNPPYVTYWAPDPGEYELYAIVISTSGETKQSPSHFITINPVTGLPSFTAEPEGASIREKDNYNLITAATDATGFQWFLNGTRIEGATQSTYSITSATMNDAGTYYCLASNAFGLARSLPVQVAVEPHEGIQIPVWEIVQLKPAFNDLNAALWTGERFVAVGNRGIYTYSTDGVVWKSYVIGNAWYNLNALAQGNGHIVAVGTAGALIGSATGTNWSTRTSGVRENLTAVAFGNERFVAVGDNDTILVSQDGMGWTKMNSETGLDFKTVTYADGLFYAAGNDGAMLTSSNGIFWTPRYTGTSRSFSTLSYANGTLVAAGSEGRVFISHDGVIWHNRTFHDLGYFRSGAFADGRFIIAEDFGRTYTSVDGESWEGVSLQSRGIFSLTYSQPLDLTLYVGRAGEVAVSSDLAEWEFASSGFPIGYRNLRLVGGLLMAVGDVARISYSFDGKEWEDSTIGFPPLSSDILNRMQMLDVAYGADAWVAVGDKGDILSSSNPGEFWNWQIAGSDDLQAVRFGNDRFVAVGKNGAIRLSVNGDDWDNGAVPGNPNLYSLEFGYNLFIAGGAEGLLLTSPDGVTWTPRNSQTTGAILAIRFLHEELRAVCANGDILRSVNGTEWEVLSSIPGESLISIAYGKGQWWVASEEGVIFVSRSGTNWIQRNAGTEWNPFPGVSSLLVRGDYLYAVGKSGQILVTELRDVIPPVQTGFAAFLARYELTGDRANLDADIDADGVPNLLEYAFNTHPLVPDAVKPLVSIESRSGQKYAAITYQRVKGAEDLVFTLQSSSDLQNWISPGATWEITVEETNSPTTEKVTLHSPQPVGASKEFFRLRTTYNAN